MSGLLPLRFLPSMLALLGCGGGGVDCADPAAVLADQGGRTLTCAQAEDVADYVHILAGRAVSEIDRERIVKEVTARFRADPAAAEAWVGAVVAEGRALEALTGTAGAEERSHRVWLADRGEGLVRPEHGAAWSAQQTALSVWAKDDALQLALTESDIEAWIRYASLCREVQGGGPLRLSVADRVTVYGMVRETFSTGLREEKVALIALGPYWSQIHDGWQMASYERQQAWIRAAPLPPPMTASSLAYAESVLGGDLVGHAWTLHERIGPFTMVKDRPAFD